MPILNSEVVIYDRSANIDENEYFDGKVAGKEALYKVLQMLITKDSTIHVIKIRQQTKTIIVSTDNLPGQGAIPGTMNLLGTFKSPYAALYI